LPPGLESIRAMSCLHVNERDAAGFRDSVGGPWVPARARVRADLGEKEAVVSLRV